MKSLLLVLLACACGAGGRGDDDAVRDSSTRDAPLAGLDAPAGAVSVFDPAITEVAVEIDYETGAAPYTGTIAGFGDTFDITRSNIDRLFSGKKLLTIPSQTSEMQDVGVIADEGLTVADLLALATAHRSQRDTPTRKTYYVLFVSGTFADENGPQPNILGVSLGGSGVIAMFKDVIDSTGVPNLSTVRYVEQTTLVHELAHAIGLVDAGVPLASPHKDAAHGAHCTNDRCVMYYLNEGANEIAAFAMSAVLANDTILFDAACLADVDALTGGP